MIEPYWWWLIGGDVILTAILCISLWKTRNDD